MGYQDIVKYFKIIRKRWWVIALLFGATVGTMLFLAFVSEEEYEAVATLQVSAPPPQEVPLYSQFGRQALRDEIAQTQASFNEFLIEGNPALKTLKELSDINLGASELREKIVVEIPEESQLMKVSIRASDPETAALLTNTLVEIGLKEYGILLAQPTVNTRNFIEQQLEGAQNELITAETELMQFQIENKIGKLNDAINSQYELILNLRKQGDLNRANGDTTQAQAIDQIILEREAELQHLISLSSQYTTLVDRVERAGATRAFLLDKRAEAQIKESQILSLSSIQVITPARPPKRPVLAIDGKIITLGAVASFMAGVLFVFLLEYQEVSRKPHTLHGSLDRPEPVGAGS